MITLHKLPLTLISQFLTDVRNMALPPPRIGRALRDSAGPLRITLLGHMQLHDATGTDITPRIRKSRAVLAVLALAAPRPVLRDELAALLWSRRDRDQGRASLRQCVHELQTLFAARERPVLEADRNLLLLRTDSVWIDVRAGVLSGAPLLNDLHGLDPAFDSWLAVERRKIGRAAAAVAAAVLLDPSDADFDAGRAVDAAERLLTIDPTHERGWRSLIGAYEARGDRAAALEAYRRCVATLSELDVAPAPETLALATRLREPLAPERPQAGPRRRGLRIGVRPFRTLGESGDDPLALGLAEEITTALARFKWIFLVATSSLAALTSEPRPDDPRWRELALDFLLDGTVQRSDGRVRVMVRLLDVKSAPEVAWAGRFDRAATDLLTLQDEIAAETVAQIDPELIIREGIRAAAHPPTSATAYDLVLSAIPAIYRLDEPSFRAAGATLAEAVRVDPGYAAAHAWWACWHIFLVGQNWADDAAVAMSHAGMLAERAIALDPTDARALTIAGHARAFLYHRLDEAMELHERALSLNPNLPLAWVLAGLADAYLGRHAQALSRVHHARQLSPFDPHGYFFDMALMLGHLLRRDFAVAVELAHRSIALNPGLTSTYKIALSALGHLGRHDEAAKMRHKLLALDPRFSIAHSVRRTPLQRPQDMALYAAGLRLAGLPE
jgi:DNA-binding SARP family transcriptional activator